MISKSKLIYLIEISWLLLLLVFASMVYLNQEYISFFFNADILGFFNFFQDIFLNHVHYRDWSLSPAPHFFPDMLIFFPFLFLTKNIYFQFLISLWVMVLFTYFAVKFIYCQFFPRGKSVFFALAATSSFFLLALKGFSPYILALVPAVHVGEFITGIFFISIQVKILSHEQIGFSFNNNSLYVISAILAFSSAASDLLFIPQFACSAFLAYIFLCLKNKIKFKQCIFFSTFTIVPAIFGGYISKYLVPHATLFEYLNHPSVKKITLNSIISQLNTIVKILKSINYEIFLGFIPFYISIFIIFYVITFSKFKNKFFIIFEKKHYFIISFIFFSVFCSFLAIFTLCGINYVLDRYIMPFYFFSFLLFFIPILSISNYNLVFRISTTIVTFIFILILVNIFMLFKQGFKLKENYYPEDIRCIDNALHDQGRNGIAQYWTARPFSMLSKEGLHINQVLPNLSPFLQSANIKYKNSYSFAIIDIFSNWILDESLIKSINGKPKKIITCGDKRLLIYPKDGLKIKNFF